MKENSLLAQSSHKWIAVWLFFLCGFVALVLVAGGMTRLTDSGLSITEWKPVTGVIPPLTADEWRSEFLKYQQIPEFRLIKSDMTLDEFKSIFWWEWGHRLLARMAGVMFLLPFLYFWLTGRLARKELPKFVLLFTMGAGQGVLGWYMVMSGLSARVDVSQYRLAAHLGLAFLIYGYSLWLGLSYWREPKRPGQGSSLPGGFRSLCVLFLAAIFLQILLGALVAGLDAGLTYNTWPLMDGYWLPPGLLTLHPLPLNLFENITMVQFNHRSFAVVLLLCSVAIWWKTRHLAKLQIASSIMLGVILGQFGIGIWTLLSVAPLGLSALHQLGALAVYSVAITLTHMVYHPVRGTDP